MRWPPRPARSISYGQLAQDCRAVAAWLRAQGSTPGEVVSVVMPNGLQTLRVLLGAMHGGWCVNPVNLLAQPEQMRYVLAHSDCRVVFVTPEREAMVRELLSGIGRDVAVHRHRGRRRRHSGVSGPAVGGAGAGCAGAADVHLRHHRHAQGRDADAGQPGGERGFGQRRARVDGRRSRARRAAAVSHQRLRGHDAGAAGAWRQPGDDAEVLRRALLDAGARRAAAPGSTSCRP